MPNNGILSSITFLFSNGINPDFSRLSIPASNAPTPGNINFVAFSITVSSLEIHTFLTPAFLNIFKTEAKFPKP